MSGSTENTTTANGTDTIPVATTTVLHVNMSSVSKLTSLNYMMWKLQVHALLDGYGLAGHLDGTTVAPSPTITTANVVSDNPDFIRWKRQDKLIYSALIGAISVVVQPTVSRTTTASQIWDKLAATYANPSRAHIKQLTAHVKSSTKGTKTIDEYLSGVVTKLDQLALLGSPLGHEDQVELILAGLPEDYKLVIDQIEGKDHTPSITEVHERLLNHENKLSAASEKQSFSGPIPAKRQYNNYNTRGYNNKKPNTNNSYNPLVIP